MERDIIGVGTYPRAGLFSSVSEANVKLTQVFDKSNTVRSGNIGFFCNRRDPQSLDALLVCGCQSPLALARLSALVKTGGILALQDVSVKALRVVFKPHWQFSFCGHGDVIWTRICRREGSSEVFWEDVPLAHYVDLLQMDIPFSYSRYGDGEFNGALETLYPGYGYQRFTPGLRRDLQASLIDYHRDPCYIMALAPIYHFRDRGQRSWEMIAAFLRENNLTDIRWHSTQPFNHASATGQLWPFIRHLQQSNIVIVGPASLKGLKKLFPKAAFVVIPDKHCHARLPAIQEAILAQKLPATILFTAGPACTVLIHKLFKEIGDNSTMIDIGTMWAPYIGKVWRGAHRAITHEILYKNIGKT